MEILHLFGTDERRTRWLEPLLAGQIRSAFAMTNPDAARHRQQSMILVPRGSDGSRASGTCRLRVQIHSGATMSDNSPLASFYTWVRALHFTDRPDEVHLRTLNADSYQNDLITARMKWS